MSENTIAIVVIAYNRPDSLKRLLSSIALADYPKGERIPLLICVDKSDNPHVAEVAENFIWEYGEKSVILQKENLGLKKHVLTCGDLTEKYGSIIMLEDDLYVSSSFYHFAEEALDFSKGNDYIGGISLYNHLLNVHVREPFEAVPDQYDNWYFQFASSWGQAFSREQWSGFRKWLAENDGKPLEDNTMPQNVSSWSDKSWLKYYIKYLIDTKKYFLYPRVSLTTNFSEEGTHAKHGEANADLQVPLAGRVNAEYQYRFGSPWEMRAVYDAFFENVCLKEVVLSEIVGLLDNSDKAKEKNLYLNRVCEESKYKSEWETEAVVIDLYGYKPIEPQNRYLLTSRSLPYKQIKSYARSLRPIDANVFSKIEGNDFSLYDTSVASAAPQAEEAKKYLYNYKALKVKALKSILSYRIKQKFKK